MSNIKFCYRKIIDIQAATAWERLVFEDTYKEFCMQFQFYNTDEKYHSFSQLLHEDARAKKMHFLTSTAAAGYITQLNNIIPDVKNVLGKTFLPFQQFDFEIIESHIKEKAKHRVAISFYSEAVTWLQTIGTHLIITMQQEKENDEAQLTETLALQPFLSIYSIKN